MVKAVVAQSSDHYLTESALLHSPDSASSASHIDGLNNPSILHREKEREKVFHQAIWHSMIGLIIQI